MCVVRFRRSDCSQSAGCGDDRSLRLLVAAAAEIEQLTVLHYDSEYEHIATVTGQPCEWVVPRGSID